MSQTVHQVLEVLGVTTAIMIVGTGSVYLLNWTLSAIEWFCSLLDAKRDITELRREFNLKIDLLNDVQKAGRAAREENVLILTENKDLKVRMVQLEELVRLGDEHRKSQAYLVQAQQLALELYRNKEKPNDDSATP